MLPAAGAYDQDGPQDTDLPGPDVNSTGVEKPWPLFTAFLFRILFYVGHM